MLAFNETHCREDLFPLTLTRPVADIRVGMLTIREKWRYSGLKISDEIPANLIPSPAFLQEVKILGLKRALEAKELYRKFNYPWELPALNDWAIRSDFELLTRELHSAILPASNRVTGNKDEIFLAPGVTIEYCYLNTTNGPIYLDEGANIMEGSMLRGPLYIGRNAVIKMGTTIYGATTIGEGCIIGGEVKNSIFIGFSNKAHTGYIGDAVIGEWCNLGAGTSCSNLRNTATEIKIWHMHSGSYMKGGLKCGLIMGDHSKASINSSFNTGTIVGVSANIFQSGALLPKYIPSFTWGADGSVKYQLDKALADIQNWMVFKHRELDLEQIKTLIEIYNKQQ
jgi:UDP-N-acetylglucosamine diphosphorylase / glucose-1-phosphate thymidylyltransferase / UDP-N-acetylgalactosamine diphosphorylase / glucosamine-1-phosphate N-acetyltransferase / galactosamine-1-phosphate N-acetyltransferase